MKKLILFILILSSTYVISAEYELRSSWDDKDIKDCQNKLGYYEKIECFQLLQKQSEEVRDNPKSISSAKTICKDLGYKVKTEKFGTCVLELTK